MFGFMNQLFESQAFEIVCVHTGVSALGFLTYTKYQVSAFRPSPKMQLDALVDTLTLLITSVCR